MDFFGIGFGELILILVVALALLGPRRIVQLGSELGKILHNLRSTGASLSAQIERELTADEKHESPDKDRKTG